MNIKPLLLALTAVLLSSGVSVAATVSLGAAESFAVLDTSTGLMAITGDLGVSPGGVITGFGPGTVTNGVIRVNDAVTVEAHTAAFGAFREAPFQGKSRTQAEGWGVRKAVMPARPP